MLLLLLCSSAQAHTWPAHCRDARAPLLCKIHKNRNKANHLRRRMGERPIPYRWQAEAHPARRPRLLAYWIMVRQDTQRRWTLYQQAPWTSATAWANEPGPSCVSGHEGGLTSVNPAGPYYGKWQADRAFEQAYNPSALSRYGDANRWPEREQDLMAYNGWKARGYSPWPATSAMCGL